MNFPTIVDNCLRKGICTVDKTNPIRCTFQGKEILFGYGYACAKTGQECTALNCPIIEANKHE